MSCPCLSKHHVIAHTSLCFFHCSIWSRLSNHKALGTNHNCAISDNYNRSQWEQGITIHRDVSSRRLQFTCRLSFSSSLPFFHSLFTSSFLSPLCPIQQRLYLFPSLSDLGTLHIICHSLKHLGKTLIHICRVMDDGGRPKDG